MVTVNTDVSMETENCSKINVNGHWLSYGLCMWQWEVKCAACGDHISGSVREYSTMSDGQQIAFWLYQIAQFDYPCQMRKIRGIKR